MPETVSLGSPLRKPRVRAVTVSGALPGWATVARPFHRGALLVGNGLSINVWPEFGYASLFARALDGGLLTPREKRVFAHLETSNFEVVLQRLTDAIHVAEAFDEPRPTERALHQSIREALGKAVQAVHVRGVPDETLRAIRSELRQYRRVFSTSYDLITYWAAAKGPHEFRGIYDFFWANDMNAFDEAQIDESRRRDYTRFYYLHGALHLVVLEDGTTCKHRSAGWGLLEQFGAPVHGDETARPLIVTEATAVAKRTRISENPYLTYCLRSLSACDLPLVVFGQSLSDADQHIVDALNQHPNRLIAVGLVNRSEERNRAEQHRVARALRTPNLFFFDAATHPLGRPELRVEA